MRVIDINTNSFVASITVRYEQRKRSMMTCFTIQGCVTTVTHGCSCSIVAFSTVGAMEGAHCISTGELVSLSEQQIVDCYSGCDPGTL